MSRNCLLLVGALVASFVLPQFAFAQTKPVAAHEQALATRAEIARSVRQKKDTAERALVALKAGNATSGLKVERDVDFAISATDIGQRLIAEGDGEAAEKFFREAAKSLEAVVKRLPKTAAREKAMHLQNLAFIQARFLNRPREAKANLDAAIELQPTDQQLQRQRDLLLSEHGWIVGGKKPKN